MKRQLAALTLVSAWLFAAEAAANSFTNGSFELGPALNGLNYYRGPPGPDGWLQLPNLDYPDIIGPGYVQGAGATVLLGAQDGFRFLDMNGANATGGLYQDVTGLVPGQIAQLSYYVGQWAQNTSGNLTAKLINPIDPLNSASFLSSDTTFIPYNPTATSSSWVQHFLTATVPGSGSLRIEFLGDSGVAFGQAAPGLDNVSLNFNNINPVPGPIVGAGLPGLVMAFGGLLAWRRRRKALTA